MDGDRPVGFWRFRREWDNEPISRFWYNDVNPSDYGCNNWVGTYSFVEFLG